MKTLKDILTGSLDYSSQWGIYATKIDGKFALESPARFGQRIFENGGLLDNSEYFSNNESTTDSRANYCGTGDDEADFYEEWAEQYLEEINSAND
ncbi:MAG TPA: hypothetical protein V6D19_05500 [Stenomitos sp.]